MFTFPLGLFRGGGGGPGVREVVGAVNASGGTTLSATIPAGGIAAGKLVVVLISSGGFSNPLASIADSRANTYAVAVTQASSASPGTTAGIGHSVLTTALLAGDTITMTVSGSTTNLAMNVVEVTGWTTIDKTAGATNTSTTPSATTVATTAASEIVFGCLSPIGQPNSPTIAEDPNFTSLTDRVMGTGRLLHTAYRIVSASGAQTYAPTFSISSKFAEVIATYK